MSVLDVALQTIETVALAEEENMEETTREERHWMRRAEVLAQEVVRLDAENRHVASWSGEQTNLLAAYNRGRAHALGDVTIR